MEDTPEQLLIAATRCLREGRVEEGIAAHLRLLSVRADLPDSWYNLGYLQSRARRFEEALHSYEQAIACGIARAEEVHLNRAVILSEHLGRSEAAEAELRRALSLNPNFITAWLNLGNLLEDLGKAAEARKAYNRALQIAPGNGRALARLAAIDTFEGKAGQAVTMLRHALGTARLSGEDFAEAAFALGHALDSSGAYDEAFRFFQQANRVAREGIPAALKYDRSKHERFVDELIRTFPLRAEVPDDNPGDAPIFICGMFRSGSTLAEQMLARHSRVTAGGEFDFLPALVAGMRAYPQELASLSPGMLQGLRANYLENVRKIHRNYDRVTDKRPDNFLHIGLIKALFPHAKIIHTVRNPMDNILSIYFLYFDVGVGYGFDLGDIAHWFAQYLRLMRHWKEAYPTDIYDLNYDEVVRHPRPSIEALVDFCELDWEEECLADHRIDSPVRTASVWQVRQALHTRSSGRWKYYEQHLSGAKSWLEAARASGS